MSKRSSDDTGASPRAGSAEHTTYRPRLGGRLREGGRNLLRAVRNEDGYRHVARRDYAFRALRRLTPYAAVDCDGIRYLVSTSDGSVGRQTYMRGGYDAEVMARLMGLAGAELGRSPLAGRTFVDIGANIGTSTIPAIMRYGAANAVAFEPASDTFALLQCNLLLNELTDRVQALQVAISDEPGTATLELSNLNWGDRRVRVANGGAGDDLLGESGWQTATVRTARFDDVAMELGIDIDRIGVAWIDTQGHEGSVLAGATTVLARRVPLVMEYWPYGLRRAGGLERLHELLGAAYPHFIDARSANKPERQPTSALPELAATYPGVDDYTDLLLLP